MNKLSNLLVPEFVGRLDHYLLTHYPLVWASKIHYLIYAWAVAMTLIGVLTTLVPISISSLPDTEIVVGISSVISVAFFVLWAINLRKHAIERDFGNTFRGYSFLRLGIYGLGISLIAMMTFWSFLAMNERISALMSEKEIISDLNTLNIGNAFFPTSNEVLPYSALQNDVAYADISSERANYFVNQFTVWNTEIEYQETKLRDEVLFISIKKAFNEDRGYAAAKKYHALMAKYGVDAGDFDEAMKVYKNGELQNEISYIEKEEVRKTLTKLAEAKKIVPAVRMTEGIFLSFIFIFPLVLALDVFVSIKLLDFFISGVSFVLIASGIFLFANVFSRPFIGDDYGNSETIGIFALLISAVATFVISMRVFRTKVFSKFLLLATFWATASMPFFVLMSAVILMKMHIFNYNIGGDRAAFALIGFSFISFLVFFYPKLRSAFQRLAALPHE